MVIQKAVDNMKERPKDERKAVAGGIAVAVVIILFLGWAFIFLKKIQQGGAAGDLGNGAQSGFNFSSVRDAQQKILEDYSGASAEEEELRTVRDAANSQYQPPPQSAPQQSSTDQFGNPTSNQ